MQNPKEPLLLALSGKREVQPERIAVLAIRAISVIFVKFFILIPLSVITLKKGGDGICFY